MSTGTSAYAMLRHRDRRFVDAYLLGKTGVDAIKKAGYKGRRPDVAASRVVAKPEVRAALEERRSVLCEAVGLRQESILAEMMKLAFGRDRADKMRALSELAEIIGLKKVAAVQQALGPGLQVVIQQNVYQGGSHAQGPALGIVVNLPPPATGPELYADPRSDTRIEPAPVVHEPSPGRRPGWT